jgi:tripartite-type tricarboxylate transporter receptor subunit TctC
VAAHRNRYAAARPAGKSLGARLAEQAGACDRAGDGRQRHRHRGAHDFRSACQPAWPALRGREPHRRGRTIGAASVAKADPDGYTILVHSTAHTIFPATFANLSFDTARDFAGVTPVVNVPLVLVVSPAKHKSLKELVASAKAKPGSINYATVGAAHMTAERLRLSAGFEAQQIPFRGAPEAQTEVLAGRVDFFFSPVLAALPLVQSGQLLALAVSSSERASALPEVPTTVEAGYPNSAYDFWIGFFLPAKTPRAIVDKLYQEIRKAKEAPDVRAKFKTLGGEPMEMTPPEFDVLIRDAVARNKELAKAAGIKPQ